MRVMVIVKARQEFRSGVMPTEQLLSEMGKFNERAGESGSDACGGWAASHL